jgi:predicted ATPase
MKLKGLPLDAVGAMLKSLSGKSPPPSVVSEIYAETEGNPFFVEELFRHLHDENRLYDSSGQFRSQVEVAEQEAPPSVRLVVARRLARLSDLTQKMLATAAVIGRSFSYEILQASSGMDSDSLLESVEQAEKAALVFSVAESVTARFAFSHELIRQAVLGGLAAARRQRLHLEVGNAIERTNAAALEDQCGELLITTASVATSPRLSLT